MPRAARFKIAAVDDLFRQLRFAPPETRAREMNAAERLIDDVDPLGTYPADFVTFRITGYRPDHRGDAAMLVGEALREDLVNLVQRLSDDLALGPDHEGRRAVPVEEVARRLSVSTKTLQRYRRGGLVCHYVLFVKEGRRLACFEDAVERFVARNSDRVARATAFTRLDGRVEHAILEEARGLRDAEGLTLNEVALRLARKHGRAHETIRGAIRRHDRDGGDPESPPIFTEHGPLSDRDLRLIHRAWQRGVSASTLARRFGKTTATVRRAVRRHHAGLLRDARIRWVDLPTFDREDAEAVILSASAVRADLAVTLPVDDALALIEAARSAGAPDEATEDALDAGYNLLKRRAAHAIEALPAWPPANAIDDIDRDLRWASMLKRRLVAIGLPHAVRRIEQNLHRPLTTLGAARIVELIERGRDVVVREVESIDPSRGQHLEGRLTYAMDRAFAGDEAAGDPRRAAARHEAGTVPLDGLLEGLESWDDVVELPARLRSRLAELSETRRVVVRRHFGLDDEIPRTLPEIASELGVSPSVATRRLRETLAALRSAARRASTP